MEIIAWCGSQTVRVFSDHITSILDDEINVEPRQCEAHSLNHIVKMINAFYFSLIRVFDHSTAFMGKKCSARRGRLLQLALRGRASTRERFGVRIEVA